MTATLRPRTFSGAFWCGPRFGFKEPGLFFLRCETVIFFGRDQRPWLRPNGFSSRLLVAHFRFAAWAQISKLNASHCQRPMYPWSRPARTGCGITGLGNGKFLYWSVHFLLGNRKNFQMRDNYCFLIPVVPRQFHYYSGSLIATFQLYFINSDLINCYNISNSCSVCKQYLIIFLICFGTLGFGLTDSRLPPAAPSRQQSSASFSSFILREIRIRERRDRCPWMHPFLPH